MIKTEKVLIVLSIISVILHLASVAGGSVLMFISLTFASCFYFAFAFALLNGIGFRGLFRASSYEGLSALRGIGSFVTGSSIATVIIGILFSLLHYEGATNMLISGSAPCIIILIVSVIKYVKNRDTFYKGIIFRVLPICIAGMIFTFIR